MDLDLKPGWEKKALIVLGIVVLIIVVYAFNPFHGNAEVQVNSDQPADTAVVTPAPPAVVSNNSTDNTTNMSGNGTFQISADVAKNIATGANPGYTAEDPTLSNVTINSTVYSVWVVPIKQGSLSKKIYVDSSTGTVVGSE